MTNQSLEDYLQNTRDRFAEASERLTELEDKRGQITQEIDRVSRERQGYKLLLETLGGEPLTVEQQAAPTASDALQRVPPPAIGMRMILSSGASGRRGENMPPRRDEYTKMTLRKAISGLAEEQPLHADVFANRIWVLASEDDLRLVKRSLNSELSRMHRAGLLIKTGRNEFRKIVAEGGVPSV